MEKQKSNIIDTMKNQAKDYYKGKNMAIRYIIIGFFLLIIVLQFMLPHKKTDKNSEAVHSTMPSHPNNKSIKSKKSIVHFLGKNFNLSDLNLVDLMLFEDAISSIDIQQIGHLYKKYQYYTSQIGLIFQKNDIPNDFINLILMSDSFHSLWDLPDEVWTKNGLIISKHIDERLNLTKSTYAFSQYLLSLYDEFESWDLVLLAYFMGPNNLKKQQTIQSSMDLKDLYIDRELMFKYYTVLGYSYLFQNIDKYVDMKSFKPYDLPKTKSIREGQIRDLKKWSQKSNYPYKLVRQLNPWILSDFLPKGKWELLLPLSK